MKINMIIILAAILCIVVSAQTNSENYIWSSGSDIPVPVRGGNTATFNTRNEAYLVIVSGRNAAGEIVKTVQRYNINTDKWDTLAPHPTGLLGGAATVAGDTLYVIGGVINPPGYGEKTVYKYSLKSNTWHKGTDFPASIADAKAVTYNDSLIYIAGGFTDIAQGGIVYLYNCNTGIWKEASFLPTSAPRNFGGFAITGSILVYICGTDHFGSSNYFDSLYVGMINPEDPSKIEWHHGNNFPGKTRSFFDAHSWDSKIIMTGGSTDNTFNTSSNECWVYNPDDNSWTQLPDKKIPWLTGQSGTVRLPDGRMALVCAGGFNKEYISEVEILKRDY